MLTEQPDSTGAPGLAFELPKLQFIFMSSVEKQEQVFTGLSQLEMTLTS